MWVAPPTTWHIAWPWKMGNTSSFTHNIDWPDMATSLQPACNIGQSITCYWEVAVHSNLCLSTVRKVALPEPNISTNLYSKRCKPFYQREYVAIKLVVINKNFRYFNRILIERRADTFTTGLRLFPALQSRPTAGLFSCRTIFKTFHIVSDKVTNLSVRFKI